MTTITIRGRKTNALQSGGVVRVETPMGCLRIQLEPEGDSVVVEKRHLKRLHQAARLGHKSRAVAEALEETEHLV